jgi:hypothetical protein
VKTAQTRLGHADPRVTLAIYASAPAAVDREAADRIGERASSRATATARRPAPESLDDARTRTRTRKRAHSKSAAHSKNGALENVPRHLRLIGFQRGEPRHRTTIEPSTRQFGLPA